MSLIAMIYLLLYTQFLKEKYTTYTKQDFLFQAVFPITSIQSMCNRTIIFRVHLIIRIKKIESYSTYIGLPNKCMNHVIHIWNINNYLISILVQSLGYRKRIEVLSIVISNLLTIHRKALLEIAVTIKETYTAHIYI